MTRYNTGNPISSKHLKDFSDNLIITDEYVNSENDATTDRFGKRIKTLKSIEKDIDKLLANSGKVLSVNGKSGVVNLLSRDVKALDESMYEKGIFNPYLIDSLSQNRIDVEGNRSSGGYFRIGNAVFISLFLEAVVNVASYRASIAGLPFISARTGKYHDNTPLTVIIPQGKLTRSYVSFIGRPEPGTSNLLIWAVIQKNGETLDGLRWLEVAPETYYISVSGYYYIK